MQGGVSLGERGAQAQKVDATVINPWRQATGGRQVVSPAGIVPHSKSQHTSLANAQVEACRCCSSWQLTNSTRRPAHRSVANIRHHGTPSELLPCVAGVAGSKVHALHSKDRWLSPKHSNSTKTKTKACRHRTLMQPRLGR